MRTRGGFGGDWEERRTRRAKGRFEVAGKRCAQHDPATPPGNPEFTVFDSLAILGTGLIGASVAAAAKSHAVARRIAVWDILPTNSRHAVDTGLADLCAATAEEAVRDADIVVIATPADTVGDIVARIAPHLKPGALVTDAASTKAHIARVAYSAMPEGRHFVGAHPMAGSEKNGPRNAHADLFKGRACFITPLSGRTDPGAVDRVSGFWSAFGAVPKTVTPDDHDEIVAYLSHLPHIAAVALALTISEGREDRRDCAGGGLRDTTRIAGGDPELWRAILIGNRHEVVRAIAGFRERLAELSEALESNDAHALTKRLESAREWRSGIV